MKYSLILFIFYLPVYLLLLIFLKTKIKGYTVRSHTVSLLATSKNPWRSIYNVSTILYGILSFILPVGIIVILGINTLNILGVFFLLGTGVATALAGVFPVNKNVKRHETIGHFVFSSVFLVGLIFTVIFSQNTLFLPFMELLNFVVVGLSVLFIAKWIFYKHVSSILEWLLFIATISWNFALALSLFFGIY